MIRYVIIDDEPIAHRIIEKYCADLPHLEKKGNCYNAFEAMQLLNEQDVDLLFLDLNMPKLSGFDFLRTLSNPPKIIVTTAYADFALESYDLDVADYLLKPFAFDRFVKAVNKALKKTMPQAAEPVSPVANTKSTLFLKGDKKFHQIQWDHILFVEAYGHYTKVYLQDEMILSNQKISALEELLPSDQFLRVHKSFIVATDKIKFIEGNRLTIQEHEIPIGQTYKSLVSKLYNS